MTAQALYLLVSLGGVAAMVGLCAALFGRGVVRVDAASAEDSLRSEIPGFRAGEIALAADGRAALVEDARNRTVYLVIARGSGLVTRKLSAGILRKAQQDGTALDLRLADFTFPKARILFAEEQTARDWQARFTQKAA